MFRVGREGEMKALLARSRATLIGRIETFLHRLEAEERPASLWEAFCIDDTLKLLKNGDFLAAEGSLMMAEQADVFGTPPAIDRIRTQARVQSAEEFRDKLATIRSRADGEAGAQMSGATG